MKNEYGEFLLLLEKLYEASSAVLFSFFSVPVEHNRQHANWPVTVAPQSHSRSCFPI